MSEGVITSAALEGKEPAKATPVKAGFESMKVVELREIARGFGVDVQDTDTKAIVLAALAEEGVTYEDYARLTKAEKVEPEVEVEEVIVVEKPKRQRAANEVIVKMNRDNYHFETFGKTFTKEHPFVVMTEDEAQEIFDHEYGFTLATPREASEYYS